MSDDDELLARLGDAIGPVDEEPPAGRIAAVRAAAEAAQARSDAVIPLADRRPQASAPPVSARHGRRQMLTGIAAAAVGLAGGAALWEVRDKDPEAGPPTEPIRLRRGDGATNTSSGELINHTWGSELLLTGRGFTTGGAHRVVFVDADDEQVAAGGFTGVGETEMLCRCTTPLMRDRLRRIEVRDPDDQIVLSADLA